MHVQEKANDLSFGEAYCGTFICSGNEAKLSSDTDVWDQLDLSVSKSTTVTSSCNTNTSSIDNAHRFKNTNQCSSDKQFNFEDEGTEQKQISSYDAIAVSDKLSFSEARANISVKLCQGCQKIIKVRTAIA